MSIAEQLAEVRHRIAAACARSNRPPQSVRLVAVSKTVAPEVIRLAAAAGQTLFGENYVQELAAKLDAVTEPVEWHFIGALQSNKVKYIAGKVAMIHSVDRLSLAREIEKQYARLDTSVEILIEVNLGAEASKAGTDADAAIELVREIAVLPHLQVRGLMLIPPYCDDPEDVRGYFRRLRELAETITALKLPGVEMRELSMGMSHDFDVAIEEGATLVRVGSAIFGARAAKA